ncbi:MULTISPECIES: ASCH domain-containing protein [Thermococcus]|uniref:ASCH domain-containing protein n=1 Tax=Thermococcus barossii TaxID=54077 RepID=A0A2Z2MMI2_9EURY|nr:MULTISPECIES: ASCH domain-containing protein [Thermococcus]ASJ05034.1 ASCH domain-containing protein [Thermococcus barossii]NJE77115.1 ASCH domain-containing protein [Thermococcus sp. ES12]
MKHLEFDGRYAEAILKGRKRATVRLGRKPNLKEGDTVLIHSGGYAIGKAIIERVESKTVGELTDEDAFLDGFSGREELIRALKEHYRYVNDDSTAHVIVFRLVERFDKPVMSSDYAYEGNLPIEIAEKALEHLDLSGEDRKLLELFLKTGSLRKAAYRLGGLNKRYLIRDALRRAYGELKRRGIMGPKV